MSRAPLTGLVVSTLVLIAPGAASACAVCFAGEEESRVAYIVMTAVLTFLPLVILGFGGYMLRRHIVKKRHELREAV